MEPRIQYAKTSDGVSIAYAVFGSGQPIVCVGGGFGDLNLSSVVLPLSEATDALVGLGWSVIRYDGRGMGSSERGNADFSLDGRLRDLEAVIKQTGVNSFALWGYLHGGPTGIAYTVKHPGGASHLVLANSYANDADWLKVIPTVRAARAVGTMVEEEWEYHTLALANAVTGFSDSVLANRFAAAFRAGMSATAYLSWSAANEKIDVTDLLPLVHVPTLVLHNASSSLSNVDLLRVLASRIPNARLVSTEDTSAAVDAFLREGEEQAEVPIDVPSGMTAILFIDIVDSTVLTERLGDAVFREKSRNVAATLRSIIAENGGRTIEGPTLGDGVLATFTSARQAIGAALACGEAGAGAGMPLHLGLHAGDVIRESDPDGRANVYGGAVNIAARISGLSAAGEVLVSDTVRSLARTSAGVRFEDRGEQALRGVGEAVRVWAVRGTDAL